MEEASSIKTPPGSPQHESKKSNTEETTEQKEKEGSVHKSKNEKINSNTCKEKYSSKNEPGGKKENDKTVTFSDTQIEISDTEDEGESEEGNCGIGNIQNPRITISEPVNSPCEEKKPQEPAKGRCPIYYGIKSYIHDFYYPPDNEVLKSGEYIQEDDFQFLVEPGKRRWKGCWFRVGLWVGINLMLVGIIAMLVGHLTTPRQTVVSVKDGYTILDRWAVTFNNRLIICQLAGLAGFTSGAVIVMLVLLVSSYQQEQARGYYVMAATVVPETFVGNPLVGPKEGWGFHRIPLSGIVRGVQPTYQHFN